MTEALLPTQLHPWPRRGDKRCETGIKLEKPLITIKTVSIMQKTSPETKAIKRQGDEWVAEHPAWIRAMVAGPRGG